MNQEIVINKILRDLKMMGLVSEDTNGEFKPYLNAIWVASWEARGKELSSHNDIPIIQLTKNGKLIKEFPNIIQASKKAKYARGTIYTALKTGTLTRRGHLWRYAILKQQSPPQQQ